MIFNWRDIKNPAAGGAEAYTHNIMRILVGKGHTVTMIVAGFKGCEDHEVIDGIEIFRTGGRFTSYLRAAQTYREMDRDFDLVIDEINTRPFMTMRFVNNGEKIVALIHQLAREFWHYEVPFPISYIGEKFLEDHWLKRYTDIPTITVSESTRSDLLELGFKDIRIVHNGLDRFAQEMMSKESSPTLVFVGRFKRAKRPIDAIEAFKLARKTVPNLRLWMIGDGEEYAPLKQKNDEGVEFFGRLPRDRKDELIAKAHLLLVPSVREGWGLVVTEANSLGTPAIGYDVPGMRDSIKDGVTGSLCASDPGSMAGKIVELLKDEQALAEMSERAWNDSKQYSIESSAENMEKALLSILSVDPAHPKLE